jgi:pilus assembly protein TadC
MLHLSDLQKKIDEAAEEIHHLTQDDRDRRPPQRELVKTIPTMMMIGMTISIMEVLLLMMLLLCQ